MKTPLAVLAALVCLTVAMGAFAQPGMANVASGQYHSCGVTTRGGAVCWGGNQYGQLGDSTYTSRASPVGVFGPSTGVRKVAVSGDFSCALLTSGAVMCWGRYPGAGGAPTQPQSIPALAGGVADIAVGGGLPDLVPDPVSQLPAGGGTVCALMADGRVRCWGTHPGNFSTGNQVADVMQLGGPAVAVSVGGDSACALVSGGAVKCWGTNKAGSVGSGRMGPQPLPGNVVGLTSGVRAIASGLAHTCALLDDRRVKCWGLNFHYMLGDGTTETRTTPVDVIGLGSDVAEVVPGAYHTCAITIARDLKCWGAEGVLGTGEFRGRGTATQLVVAVSSASVASAGGHTCAVTTGGRAMCFGFNGHGQLGFGSVSAGPGAGPLIAVDVAGFAGHAPSNYQGLWWNAPAGSESGWGLNLTHEGEVLFGTWFTYGPDGKGTWFVMPEGRKTGFAIFEGALYRTTGPALASAWDPTRVSATPVGSATLVFAGPNDGTFSYTLDGVTQSKPVTRQVYSELPVCAFDSEPSRHANYRGLWWRSPAGSESGWGVNIEHQGEILFATWFTYDSAGRPMWLVLPAGPATAPRTYAGALYRTSGTPFDRFSSGSPPITATPAGHATFTFTDAGNGQFAYTVDGVSGSKAITRQVVSFPPTTCRPG